MVLVKGSGLGLAEASLLTPGASCQNFKSLGPEFPALPPQASSRECWSGGGGRGLPQLLSCSGQTCCTPHHQQTHPKSNQQKPSHHLSRCHPLPTSCLLAASRDVSRYTYVHLSPSLKNSPGQNSQGPAEPGSCPLPSSLLTTLLSPSAPAPGHPASLERGNLTAATGRLHILLPLPWYNASHTPPRAPSSVQMPPPSRSLPRPPWLKWPL